jgi:site-specific DNA-methyltransferase (adenine-specific)
LNEVFHFELDACARDDNTKCARFISEEEDALKTDRYFLSQGATIWINPPYARYVTKKWVEKIVAEAREGCRIVALLPARVDTEWFDLVFQNASSVSFVRGRIKFVSEGYDDPAFFPSALCCFGFEPDDKQIDAMAKIANVVML